MCYLRVFLMILQRELRYFRTSEELTSFISDVRRAILNHIPINNQSLPAILERSRDTDTNVRKGVYIKLLYREKNTEGDGATEVSNDIVDPHPRNLTLLQRELITQTGLGDREPVVRSAARKLLLNWINAVDAETKSEDMDIKNNPEKIWQTTLPAFLDLFNLVDGSDVAIDALFSAFSENPAIIEKTELSGKSIISSLSDVQAIICLFKFSPRALLAELHPGESIFW